MTSKVWGGRFKKSLDRRAGQFNASLSFDHILYEQDIAGSQVHARMLARQGLLNEEEAQAICNALQTIRQEIRQGIHSLTEDHEDIHMLIEHLLIDKIGETGKKLHTGRSRNDQVALDIRLYARDAGQHIKLLLEKLIACLQGLTDKHDGDWMPGYTHLQQAQPVKLGQYFAAYQGMFERDLSRLADWRSRMNYSPLGAGALAGSSLPLDRAWTASQLGFSGVISNTLDAVSDRDFVIELGSFASILMMHLSRMSEDLILWATQEFNFVNLDDAFATGSSLMPNKKNPDIPELIRGKSGRVFGHLMGMLTVMKGLPLSYNKDMQEDKEALFDTCNTVIACLEVMTPFLESLQFNIQLMQEKAHSGFLNATAVLETLVMQGIAFREAHHQVGSWVAEAMSKNCSLADIMKDRDSE
ncbi:argininosuccinate lyase [Legionella quinlivanii]|uniref:argininosuccinate lyase n=1 Tax=Legionella quinlivanii TaxID=45073 RepID=UPI002244A609|nr:argininosuccinate lyase [Legionella quinlivanii]MCW8450958.1 argininosuccinate lyase [Legionella quinlivanii]